MKLELDTGATVTLMPEETFGRLFPGKQIVTESESHELYNGM